MRNILNNVEKNIAAWKHIPADDIQSLRALYDSYAEALQATAGQHTNAQTLARNMAKDAATKSLRIFVNRYLRFDPVTNVDRLEMDIPNRDTVLTKVPPPKTQPTGLLAFPGTGLIDLHDIRPIRNRVDDTVRYGVRIYYGIVGIPSNSNRFRLAARPESSEELPHSVFTRRRRHRFDFTAERGHEVFFCMRFENAKGQAGPWGKIISAFVP